MALLAAVAIIGAVSGFFIADAFSDDGEDDNVANMINIVNNITARITISNSTSCNAEIKLDQELNATCGAAESLSDQCGPDPTDSCRKGWENYMLIKDQYDKSLKESAACRNAAAGCGCNNITDPILNLQCLNQCNNIAQYACFKCIFENITQTSFASAVVSNCEQVALTAAKTEASLKSASDQTNIIVSDALGTLFGNELQSNVTDITNSILNEFEFQNSLECSARATINQTMNLVANEDTIFRGLTQNGAVTIGTNCMQSTESYTTSVSNVVNETSQFLDQTYKSPFSFLTDIGAQALLGMIVGAVVIIIIIVVVVIVMVVKGKSNPAESLDNNPKTKNGLAIGGGIVGFILLGLIIAVAVLASNEANKNNVIATTPLPNQRFGLSTIAPGSGTFWIYAPGPLMLAMTQDYVQNLLGNDEYSINKLSGQALARFLIRKDSKDMIIPQGLTETLSAYMYVPIPRIIERRVSYMRCYVSNKTTQTQINEVIEAKEDYGEASYLNLTTQSADLGNIFFEPAGEPLVDTFYIYQLLGEEGDPNPPRKYLQIRIQEVNEGQFERVVNAINSNEILIANTPNAEKPTEEELLKYQQEAEENKVKYGFLDWKELGDQEEPTPWLVNYLNPTPLGTLSLFKPKA